MRIFLTNDDGFAAQGLQTLVSVLSQESDMELVVVAPERERSATGHAITLHKPLQVIEEQPHRFMITGTPVDCAKLGISTLCTEPPDLVISGINHGANLGTDVYYSGTVSAAIESVLMGYPAVAVSLFDGEEGADFRPAAEFMRRLVRSVASRALPPRTLLNVNIPPVPPDLWQGVRIARLGVRHYEDLYERRIDPRGRPYYWLGGQVHDEHNEPDTDVWAIYHKYVAITPLNVDPAAGQFLNMRADWSWEEQEM